MTSLSRGALFEIDPVTCRHRPIDTGGRPNGLAQDASGRTYIAQAGGAGFPDGAARAVPPGIQIMEADVVESAGIPSLLAPNDCAIGPDGALWFTDPGSDAAFGPRVLRWAPGANAARVVADDLVFPNGLAFSADGSALFVADSTRNEIVRYAVTGRDDETTLVRDGVFASLPDCGPDGLALDADGCLYVAAFERDEVVVLDPEGTVAERLQTGSGSHPSNLCFFGSALQELAVTLVSGGRVVATRREVPGARLFD